MKMLEDLEEVVRLQDAAEHAAVALSSEEFAEADKDYSDKACIYIATHHATIRDMAARLEVLRCERDHERACRDRCVQILGDIHALLYPRAYTNTAGVTFVFHSPHVHEQMQALSDRIRAIPEAIDQAMQETGR